MNRVAAEHSIAGRWGRSVGVAGRMVYVVYVAYVDVDVDVDVDVSGVMLL